MKLPKNKEIFLKRIRKDMNKSFDVPCHVKTHYNESRVSDTKQQTPVAIDILRATLIK